MSKNSRAIGVRAEKELTYLMREFGFEARRGQQHKGTSDSPDIIHDMEGFHIEVKKREKFTLTDIYTALDKAQAEAGEGDDALLFYTRNRDPWLVVMDARRFLALMKEIYE